MKKIPDIYWEYIAKPFLRKRFLKNIRNNYDYSNKPSIISSNCIAGEIYNDLGMKFFSPTINLWMSEMDFLKFVTNLSKYINSQLMFYDITKGYPIGKLIDIDIHFLHYKSIEEARKKWEDRCLRIDFNNIYVIMCDLDLSDDQFNQFFKIKGVKKKILFTTNPERKDYEDVFYIKSYKPNSYVRKYAVNRLNGFRDFERFWDFVSWLND